MGGDGVYVPTSMHVAPWWPNGRMQLYDGCIRAPEFHLKRSNDETRCCRTQRQGESYVCIRSDDRRRAIEFFRCCCRLEASAEEADAKGDFRFVENSTSVVGASLSMTSREDFNIAQIRLEQGISLHRLFSLRNQVGSRH